MELKNSTCVLNNTPLTEKEQVFKTDIVRFPKETEMKNEVVGPVHNDDYVKVGEVYIALTALETLKELSEGSKEKIVSEIDGALNDYEQGYKRGTVVGYEAGADSDGEEIILLVMIHDDEYWVSQCTLEGFLNCILQNSLHKMAFAVKKEEVAALVKEAQMVCSL